MRFLHLPFHIRLLGLDEFNPLEITAWNLTLLFGPETVVKWRRIVQRKPRDANAHVLLGGLLRVEKRYEEAIAVYQTALNLLPHNISVRHAQVHYDLGNVLLACGRREEARSEWERVLEIVTDGFGDLARKQLIEFLADGNSPPRRYVLVVVDNTERVSSQEFDNLDVAYREYENRQKSLRDTNLGIGLAQFHPDGKSFEAAWIMSRKGKEARQRFVSLFHRHIGVDWSS